MRDPRSPGALNRPSAQQQRHAQRRLVEQDAVRLLAVLPQRFTVVRGHDGQQILDESARLEVREQPAELRVAESDLRIVGVCEALLPSLDDDVGLVRIEEVHPDEEALIRTDPGEPRDRVVHHLVGGALDLVRRQLFAGPGRRRDPRRPVDLEALGQAEARVEHERPHEGGRKPTEDLYNSPSAPASEANREGHPAGLLACFALSLNTRIASSSSCEQPPSFPFGPTAFAQRSPTR